MEIIIKGSPEELAELLAGLRTEQAAGAKESAPQKSIAEQSVENLHKLIAEKTDEFFEEYVNAVYGASDNLAKDNYNFYLRQAAHNMWEMLSESIIADIWNIDTLFL